MNTSTTSSNMRKGMNKARAFLALAGLLFLIMSITSGIQELFGIPGFLGQFEGLVSNFGVLLILIAILLVPIERILTHPRDE